MTSAVPLLDHAGIAARIPHAGTMCLLDRLEAWSETRVHCSAVNQQDPAHPLRSADGLLAPVAIEYAAQAMALHGALGQPPGATPRPGMLVSVRDVRCQVERLDTIAGRLQVEAERLAGEATQVQYRFVVADAGGRPLVEGRATVVLGFAPSS